MAAACGPSSSELKTVRETRYNAEPLLMLKLAAEAVQGEHYQIGTVDQKQLAFVTVPRVYNREGGLEGVGADNYVVMRPGSVEVFFAVRVVPDPEHYVLVTVTPKALQFIAGSPQPRELAPDDPYLPSFVTGRVDALTSAIYEHAKAYALAPP